MYYNEGKFEKMYDEFVEKMGIRAKDVDDLFGNIGAYILDRDNLTVSGKIVAVEFAHRVDGEDVYKIVTADGNTVFMGDTFENTVFITNQTVEETMTRQFMSELHALNHIRKQNKEQGN